MHKLNIDAADGDGLKRCSRLLIREEAAAYIGYPRKGFRNG